MNIYVLNYGIYNISEVNIKIYKKSKLLINDYINNKTHYNLTKGIYIIKLYSHSNLLGEYPIIHIKKEDNYYIYLNNNSNNIKIFYLYDYYYPGLKIKKGEIILGT